MPCLFAHTELILVVTEPVARGLLVCAQREFLLLQERASSCHEIFLCVREAVVVLLRESQFLSQDFCFCACERLLSRQRKFLLCERCIGARREQSYQERYCREIRPNQAQYPSGADWSSSLCEWPIEHPLARVCVYFYGVATSINELLAR